MWAPDYVNNMDMETHNFVEGFECYVCDQVHENLRRQRLGKPIKRQWGDAGHFDCRPPGTFDKQGRYGSSSGWENFWSSEWEQQRGAATQLHRELVRQMSKQSDDVLIIIK